MDILRYKQVVHAQIVYEYYSVIGKNLHDQTRAWLSVQNTRLRFRRHILGGRHWWLVQDTQAHGQGLSNQKNPSLFRVGAYET